MGDVAQGKALREIAKSDATKKLLQKGISKGLDHIKTGGALLPPDIEEQITPRNKRALKQVFGKKRKRKNSSKRKKIGGKGKKKKVKKGRKLKAAGRKKKAAGKSRTAGKKRAAAGKKKAAAGKKKTAAGRKKAAGGKKGKKTVRQKSRPTKKAYSIFD